MGRLVFYFSSPHTAQDLFHLTTITNLIFFFAEGVVVAQKDYNINHTEIDTRNLYVIKALQSLTSKGYAKTRFSWQYYYYTLTDSGVEYLRNWLGLPNGVVPATHKKAARPQPTGGRPERRPRNNDGEGYKRRENKETAGGNFQPQYN
ncbi:hypothetical protein DV451_002190 [Geotrichum candidum]|uniref:Plectin/eS10 N-terminal domain-containing protein n=1 Tax=Geotrichum candidum TaxID=1173061 RepID=A0A9P5G5E1_GEOCN|nr:hypothetical protein DV451_002190 [Geotrichum candidum]KAF5110330.1 hypothetical protein DV453_000985 [Geotrichum candidum]